MAEKFEIKGLREVERALKELPAAMAASVLRNAHREVLNKNVRKALKALPYRRKKVGIQIFRSDKTAVAISISSENFWLRYLDRGTGDRVTVKGWKRGRIEGNNMISNIINQQEKVVIDDVKNNYTDIIIKHLNRKITSVNKRISKIRS